MNIEILATFERATPEQIVEGTAWYADSKRIIREDARRYNLPVATVAGVYASCSIRQSWAGNVTIARRWLRGEQCGLPAVQSRCKRFMAERPATLADAVAIIRGDAATPPEKITNFLKNLLGDTNAVTVDGWAMVAAGYAETFASAQVPKGPKYNRIADEYREIAAHLNMAASAVQSITWIVVRGKAR